MNVVQYTKQMISAFSSKERIDQATFNEMIRSYNCYALFFQPRSGSTYLADLLGKNGLSWPYEWVNCDFLCSIKSQFGLTPSQLGVDSINDYIKAVAEIFSGIDRLLGIKLSFQQARALKTLLGSDVRFLRSSTTFYLRRRDIVAQAVSLGRASMSTVYHTVKGVDQKEFGPLIALPSPGAIAQNIANIIASENAIEDAFKQYAINPFRIWYEDLISDPAAVISSITYNLGSNIKRPFITDSALTKIGDDKSVELIELVMLHEGEKIKRMSRFRPKLSSSDNQD